MINKSSLLHISENRELLLLAEDFAYLLPRKNLKSLISNFTITFPNRTIIPDNYSIMPHGSVTLVLFYYNTELHSFLFGPTTKSIKVGNIANQCEIIFIIEFQPAGFSTLKNLNQNELTDKIIPFSSIDFSLDTGIKKIFKNSTSVDELLSEIETEILQNIMFQYPKELHSAINLIIQMEGIISSSEVSDKTHYCSRHLNRLFNLYLGMSIKTFSRLVRINKSFHLLHDTTNTLATICEKLGYYDVSHFVKDFKIVCNITPQDFRNNMSDFYSEIAKF